MKETFLFVSLLLFFPGVRAQQPFPSGSAGKASITELITMDQAGFLDSIYYSSTGADRQFIYGRDYVPYFNRSANKPVLRYGQYRTASLVFNGRRFDNIELQYDTYHDELVYVDDTLIFNDRKYQVALNSDFISGFDLYFASDTLRFGYFNIENCAGFNLPDGFYEIVYLNKCKCLIRHSSSRYKYNGTEEYSYNPVLYASVGGSFLPVTSKKRLTAMFGEHSTQVRHYIESNHIKLRNGEKGQIAGIFRFYEGLADE